MTTLFIKHGRRYRVWGDVENWYRDGDVMRVGESRLVVCTEPGGRRYTYGVTPDFAGFVAAAELAGQAMQDAIADAAKYTPELGSKSYTPKQHALIQRFRDDMAATGALVPAWWTGACPQDIVRAGIEAAKAAHVASGGDLDDDWDVGCHF